jgi:dimethylargininase
MSISEETRAGYGCQSMSAPLRRVMVRTLRDEDVSAWKDYGWRAKPDLSEAKREHEALCRILADYGAEVISAEAEMAPNPDAIYVHDPVIVADAGAIILRPGKQGRRTETEPIAQDLERAGVPIAVRLEGPATAEGGDMVWLDNRTLLVGRTYRTNSAGIAALAEALPDVDVVPFDLPHLNGRGEVLHLMSLLSPLAPDLAVSYLPLMPVRLIELLEERGVRLIPVPVEEFDTMGPNVLALQPRVALAIEGNPETRRRMEGAGVDVTLYRGNEISRKGDGGPTCLTRPILRS